MYPVPVGCGWVNSKIAVPYEFVIVPLSPLIRSTTVARAPVAVKRAAAAMSSVLIEETLIFFILRLLSFSWRRVVMTAFFMIPIFLIIASHRQRQFFCLM